MKNKFRPGRCRNVLIFLLLLKSFSQPVYSQKQYWQQEVNYRIDVSLNDNEHSLDGFEELTYINHSPDSLFFIWFHIWPNAYKNDRTAFSEQLLRNGRTDFYFATKAQRGYINRLDFKVKGVTARLEDHPEHIDILKLVLPAALPPGDSISITTPFHVQLPYNFSRGGHDGQSYQVTQWYPKPAVYDSRGWHPMPYLDQGEFYSEFGNYDVTITVPSNYVVAATGVLQDEAEKNWLKTRTFFADTSNNKTASKKTKQASDNWPESSATTKSLQYIQKRVHDFAWFADKRFVVNYDKLALPSGRVIDVYSYYVASSNTFSSAISSVKNAVLTRSSWLGEYPYDIVSAVETNAGIAGGMEYPTITAISPILSQRENDVVIGHEIGHNWLQGILANNERRYTWMDEGMNSYYDNRYEVLSYSDNAGARLSFGAKRLPQSLDKLYFETMAAAKLDQPINTSAEDMSAVNYGLINYHKAASWMKKLEERIGTAVFDSCMRSYFRTWQFRHPYPEDFKSIVTQVSGLPLDDLFAELEQKGSLEPPVKKKLKLTTYFNLKETNKYQYISVAPAIGYNMYDGFQVGAFIHNYQLPLPRFQFLATPLFATRSKTLNGLIRGSYNGYTDGEIQQWEIGAAASSFTMDEFQPENASSPLFMKFRKFAPFVKLRFRQPALTNLSKHLQLKWYHITEDELNFQEVITGTDTSDLVSTTANSYNIGELKYVVANSRALYPFQAVFGLQYHKDFLRATVTANYFYNYASNKGGIKVRWFAGKFFHTSSGEFKTFDTERFHLNMTGARGYEDYTYSNYFVGRNEFEGFASQQLMMRDGGFKVGTDLLDSKLGKTDDWLTALNFTIHIPDISDKLPVKLFFDIGTYAEAWQQDAEGSRFVYDAGLQLSLFKETINVYVPFIYSNAYKSYYNSVLTENRLLKTISFSIDIQDLTLKKINKELVF